MLAQVYASAATVRVDQQRAIWITVIVTAIAAILGLLFAGLVGTGITRPVRLLLQGTREVEAGQLDRSIDVVTRDEIGQLTAAFNRMVGQLRHKEQIRRTFGRYIDPRVVEGLINQSAAAATEGQRRVMTVMFCDMKGFTGLSEGMTPQGLVKVMNRYLSTMSEPIRAQKGSPAAMVFNARASLSTFRLSSARGLAIDPRRSRRPSALQFGSRETARPC